MAQIRQIRGTFTHFFFYATPRCPVIYMLYSILAREIPGTVDCPIGHPRHIKLSNLKEDKKPCLKY